MTGTAPEIPVSWGEMIDKITILEIKSARLTGESALANVRAELALLAARVGDIGAVAALKAELRAVNEALWDVENRIREKEAAGAFDAEFVALARAVYARNDARAALKRRINLALSSALVEEKSYSQYSSS